MLNDTCVFIFSNGRANSVKTFKSLKDVGCENPIKIIVDNLDGDKNRYISKFGKDAVLQSASCGRLCFETFKICKNTPARATNAGGLQNLYRKFNDFQRAMFSVIVAPSCVKIRSDNGVASVIRKFAYPKILRESVKR